MLQTITKDMTNAMKEQDKFTLSVLRMLKSALQLEKISKKHDLTDEEIIAVIKKQVKTRKDSIEEYKKYEKNEEVKTLENEIKCLSKYLPEEMSEEEMNKILDEIFIELNPTNIKDMGKVMKEATARMANRCDMSAVSTSVKNRLQ